MLSACRDYRARLMELARGHAAGDRRVLLAHGERCAECTRFLEEQTALSAALGELACEIPPEMAAIEPCALAEFDRVRRGRRWRLPAVGALLAAAAAIGFFWVEGPTPTLQREAPPPSEVAAEAAPVKPAPVQRVSHARAPRAVEEAPFLPIPYTVPLVPEERASVVRMQVSMAALIAAGYEVETSDPGGLVDADVLVSQDGRARAIRLNTK